MALRNYDIDVLMSKPVLTARKSMGTSVTHAEYVRFRVLCREASITSGEALRKFIKRCIKEREVAV